MPNEEAQPKVSLESLGYSNAQVDALLELLTVPGQPFQGFVTSLPVTQQNQASDKPEPS